MFKLTFTTVESFGREYFNDTVVTFGKSPKQCYQKMHGVNHGQRIHNGGHPDGIGGTPVIFCERLEKDGKVLKEIWD